MSGRDSTDRDSARDSTRDPTTPKRSQITFDGKSQWQTPRGTQRTQTPGGTTTSTREVPITFEDKSEQMVDLNPVMPSPLNKKCEVCGKEEFPCSVYYACITTKKTKKTKKKAKIICDNCIEGIEESHRVKGKGGGGGGGGGILKRTREPAVASIPSIPNALTNEEKERYEHFMNKTNFWRNMTNLTTDEQKECNTLSQLISHIDVINPGYQSSLREKIVDEIISKRSKRVFIFYPK